MDELYQAQILNLARAARASRDIARPTHHAHAKNTTCGDDVSVFFTLKDNVIDDVHIAALGCALCEAGAGLLLDHAKGKTLSELHEFGAQLTAFLNHDAVDDNGTLSVFTPVKAVKNRHKCVTLAFQATDTVKII